MGEEAEKHDEFVRRLGEEMVTWRRVSEHCQPGYSFNLGTDYGRDLGMYLRLDEKTAAKWRSFAASMIDQCEMRLREEVLKNG